MTSFVKRTAIGVSKDALHAWHTRPGAFERLTPPWAGMRMIEGPPAIAPGERARLELSFGPIRLPWHSRYEEEPSGGFRDIQERGPMKRWVHAHRFLEGKEGGAILEDEIDYELPLGALGRGIVGKRVARRLERLFDYRHAVTRADLERHAEIGLRPMRIAISGASGLVGSSLAVFLSTGGHAVLPLVRRSPKPGSDEIRFDTSELEGTNAVVHLAGENIAGRWTAAKKERIRKSRIDGTRQLAEALARLSRPPRVLVSASAIGYYGDRGDERLDESSAPGTGFLPDTCREWEEATAAAERAGIRVVHLRIGIVLAAGGGALARMLPPFRLGLGGKVGHGRQWMSWIALDDLIGAIHFAIANDALSGAVNAVAPAPVSNAEFTTALARVVHRPAVFPLPALAVRAAFGEMGQELLLGSTRVVSTRLERAGFVFRHAGLEEAFRFELGLVVRVPSAGRR